MAKKRILYLHPNLGLPPKNKKLDRFFAISTDVEGDVLHALQWSKPEEVEAVLGPGSYPVYQCGTFRYHWFLAGQYSGVARRLHAFRFFIRKGLELLKEQRYDCIMAYSHMTNGLLGVLLKLLTARPLVIEIATSPNLVYITERPRPTFGDYLRKLYSDLCLHISVLSANNVHLLYPAALQPYPLLHKAATTVFHEFVPVNEVPPRSPSAERFVLMVGAPWYLKGIDSLILAFHKIADQFPDVRLKIQGYYPDRTEIDALVANHPRIEILPALPYHQTLERMSQAELLVLPSRCEGMGRVLIEAMALGLPVVGSDVGGIPHMIHNDVNGFIFAAGDSDSLAQRLTQLLSDADLRQRLGERGFQMAHQQWDEKAYREAFLLMINRAIGKA
ncbi:glycosyltransferase family 4 protein [Bryobacter aggregatus]|uniref:glycosyltransferase family 4 protein n=1 Tax=Bryobacter aggregatus TaxID=360054 RepID=UPI00138E1BD7|nr:glycosyltransferase family 4 protein [Bryobacter aggregatus]